MAEVVYRTRNIVQHQRTADLKRLRLDRKNNRGLYVNTSTGLTTRNRRNMINRAIALGTRDTPAIKRERLRKGWTLQDSLTTVQGA